MIGFDDTVQLGIFISSIKNDGVFMAGVPPLSHTPSITDLLALSPCFSGDVKVRPEPFTSLLTRGRIAFQFQPRSQGPLLLGPWGQVGEDPVNEVVSVPLCTSPLLRKYK